MGTCRSMQKVQTQMRLLLKELSDQGVYCLSFHQHLLDPLLQCKTIYYISDAIFSNFERIKMVFSLGKMSLSDEEIIPFER